MTQKSSFFIAGRHAVIGALKNPERRVIKIFLTEESKKTIHKQNPHKNLLKDLKVFFKTKKELDKYCRSEDILHQGYVAEIEHIEQPNLKDFIKDNESFIYLISTNGGPSLWCGGHDERSTLFHNIKEHTKQHIRDGKVLVTIDMSFEGFPMDGTDKLSIIDMMNNVHIAEVIHRRAEEESFPTENIVLLSANHKDPENYRKWCKENNIKKPINWILLESLGKAVVRDNIDKDTIFRIFGEM